MTFHITHYDCRNETMDQFLPIFICDRSAEPFNYFDFVIKIYFASIALVRTEN